MPSGIFIKPSALPRSDVFAVGARLLCCGAEYPPLFPPAFLLSANSCSSTTTSVVVGVASGLNAAGDGDLRSLTQIFLCKFCLSAESNASDKVCGCGIAVSAESAVNSQCITGYRCGVLSSRVSDIGISGQSSHQYNFIHSLTS